MKKSKSRTLALSVLLMVGTSLLYNNCTSGFKAGDVVGSAIQGSTSTGGTTTPTPTSSATPNPTPGTGNIPVATPTPAPTSTPNPGNGSSGTSPLPTNIANLIGCNNPYTNNSMDVGGANWGVQKWIYTDTNSMGNIGKFPSYSSNKVFWTSRESAPGLPVLMNGAFTGNAKTIRIVAVPTGMKDWQTAVRASSTTVAATNLASTGLRFVIPSNMAKGVYAIRIEDSSAAAVEMILNAPKLDWALGMPANSDVLEAPKQILHNCGAEAGGVLRIFGKNFPSSPSVILHDSGTSYYQLSVVSSDENSISVSVPASISSGNYYVWLGAGTQDAASSLASPVTIVAKPSGSLNKISCNLNGDGSTDNASAMQSCLDSNQGSATATNPNYISLPAGNFVIGKTITLHPHQYIIGASTAGTTITGKSSGSAPATWIQGTAWFGLENLTLKAPVSKSLVAGNLNGDPAIAGHVLIQGVNLTSGQDYSGGNQFMLNLSGPDIRINQSTLYASSGYALQLSYGDGVYVGNTNIPQDKDTSFMFQANQNVIFEKNTVIGAAGVAGGISFSRPFWEYVPSMISQNLYAGYNTMAKIQAPLTEGFTTDGGAQAYIGPIASASNNTVTVSNDMDYQWVGVTNPQTLVVSISQGTGVGQFRMVKAISGRQITLMDNWDVNPDNSSIVSVTSSQFRFVISHNIITDVIYEGAMFYANTFDSVIESNTLTNAGLGVYNVVYNDIYLNVVDADIINNTVAKGANTMFTADPLKSGFILRNFQGTSLSGIYVRGNTVESGLTFDIANGITGISTLLIEGNNMSEGDWTKTNAPSNASVYIK